MPPPNIKQVAHCLVEQLPDNATWDDLLYEICVQQAIETGVIESATGGLSEASAGWAQGEATL